MDTHKVSIRRATEADALSIVKFLRDMLADMASVGGYAVSTDKEPWANMKAEFQDQWQSPEHLHLLAERPGPEAAPVGWAFAWTTARDALFEPARVLHISALYVSPAHRRRGIGRTLLAEVLEWGRSEGCTEAELSVLVDNPARSLYGDLGFSAFEIEMTRKL
jgi:GNAT superfamily N-acetyltransferase